MRAEGGIMKARQFPMASIFVVRLSNGSSIANSLDALRKFGTVEPVKGYKDRCLLRVEGQSNDPKVVWQKLRQQLGDEFDVDPAFADDRGTTSYPTGEITVRFEQTPSDDELSQYERQCGLHVKARNQYIKSQVTFEQTEHERRYLPEVLETIQRTAKHIRAVWPDTISEYSRD